MVPFCRLASHVSFVLFLGGGRGGGGVITSEAINKRPIITTQGNYIRFIILYAGGQVLGVIELCRLWSVGNFRYTYSMD
jgi:hypothetical protein